MSPAKPPKPFTLSGTTGLCAVHKQEVGGHHPLCECPTYEEARCVITNGGPPTILTEGEVMTLRVAVSSMLQDLRQDRGEALGEIGQMYINNLERLERLLCVRES